MDNKKKKIINIVLLFARVAIIVLCVHSLFFSEKPGDKAGQVIKTDTIIQCSDKPILQICDKWGNTAEVDIAENTTLENIKKKNNIKLPESRHTVQYRDILAGTEENDLFRIQLQNVMSDVPDNQIGKYSDRNYVLKRLDVGLGYDQTVTNLTSVSFDGVELLPTEEECTNIKDFGPPSIKQTRGPVTYVVEYNLSNNWTLYMEYFTFDDTPYYISFRQKETTKDPRSINIPNS